MAAIGRQREREVTSFDDGELWCDDSATPPTSPAGWYFRERRGAPALWIGPFADAEAAREAPSSGDPLRDARRYLDRWQRGESAPRPRLVVVSAEPAILPEPPLSSMPPLAVEAGPEPGSPPVPTTPRHELGLAGGAATRPPKPGRTTRRRASSATQLALDL